ncbi:TPA: hypothetical protein ACN1ND_000293 [Enterococcus faecalis]|nr:hypothetical protein [Enterococcus faecalis]EKQ3613542.1 hypothetical protein [Enterococcus faecalis]
MIDAAVKALKEIEKNRRKLMIQLYGSHKYATASTRKALMKEQNKQLKEEIKSLDQQFSTKLSSAAKGKWVDSAKKEVQQISNKFN